jgi:hypothetical protein
MSLRRCYLAPKMSKKWSASAATALASQLAALDLLNSPETNIAEGELQDSSSGSSPESANLPLFEIRPSHDAAATDKDFDLARVSLIFLGLDTWNRKSVNCL